jgi:hypothetical protein
MNNIRELFKILNSDFCNKFYKNVNDDNKKSLLIFTYLILCVIIK